MGSLISKRDFGLLDSSDDQTQLSSTPMTASAVPRRFLPKELDPRSPSANVDRTPISFIQPEVVADPRSPSSGIVRTPVVCLPAESDDVLPAAECTDSPMSDPSPVALCNFDDSQVNNDVSDIAAVSTESLKTEAECDAKPSAVTSSASYAVSPAGSKLFGSHSSGSQRSPLAPRNFAAPCSSTPRSIIQRKQSANVDKLRSLDVVAAKRNQQLQSSCDKENM